MTTARFFVANVTDQFQATKAVSSPSRFVAERAEPAPVAIAPETGLHFLMQFVPRGQSKLVFILAVTSYDYMLASLIGTIAKVFHVAVPTVGYYFARYTPASLTILAVVVAPILESLVLVGVIELARGLRAPVWAQVAMASSMIAVLHCLPFRIHGLIVAPSFFLQAASYIYWRMISRKIAYGIVVCIHALSNLISTLYVVSYAIRHT